ncbi:MAG TPA: ABC transporter permease, partial [Candidatus Limnocylindrales bacterium]
MKALVIAWTNVVRMLRDRLGLFFVFALPIVIIVLFGLAFGGSARARIGVVDSDGSALSAQLVGSVEQSAGSVEVRTFASLDELRDQVARSFVQIGLHIPGGFGKALGSGGTASVEYVSQQSTVSNALTPFLNEAVQREAAVYRAARFATQELTIPFDEALA